MSDKKLRILLAANISGNMGGIGVNYRSLLASSYSQRLDVRVIETSRGNLTFQERGRINIANWLNAVANVWGFFLALQRERPDIVHIGSAFGASFAKHSVMALMATLMRTTVVMQLHCSLSRLIPARNTLWRRYVLFVLKRIAGIATLSEEWGALSQMLPEANTCYIPNAIDIRPYIVLPRPRSIQIEGVNLLFLGHIGREKGCFDLLYAVERLKERNTVPFCLHFVGESLHAGEKDELKAEVEVRKLQSCVQVHEPEYEDRKIARFTMSDVFVLPSYHEGMPMSVIEAMAAGLPVIGTAVGGILDQVISGQTGCLVKAGDVQALAGALLRLIENPAERLEMGLAGRRRAIEQYDIETKSEGLIAFYHKLANKC